MSHENFQPAVGFGLIRLSMRYIRLNQEEMLQNSTPTLQMFEAYAQKSYPAVVTFNGT